MSPEPPARMPDLVTALLRRWAGPAVAAARAEQAPLPTRDQVHQLVDQLLDVGATLASITKSAHAPVLAALRESSRTATDATTTAAGARAASRPGDVPVAWLRPDGGGTVPASGVDGLSLGPVGPGESARGEVIAYNDGAEPSNGVRLRCSVLRSGAGQQIAGEALTVDPDPFDLAPRSARKIEVLLEVPGNAAPGSYRGLLSSAGNPGIRTAVVVEVG